MRYSLSTMSTIPLRETRAYIDLTALRHNLRVLDNCVPSARLIPTVKADGYGHGALAIARACQEEGVTMVAVANLEEAAVLRDGGITIPILLLEELFPDEIVPALRLGVRLTVASHYFAKMVSDVADQYRSGDGETDSIPVHVNLDTGMGRMGLYADDPVTEVKRIAALPGIRIEGIYSHFSSSDESDYSVSYRQMERFRAVLEGVRAAGIDPVYCHLGNSGALLNFPGKIEEAACNLARPGISIYGLLPADEVEQQCTLQPIMKLVSRIIKLTTYKRDQSIGYGRTYTAGPGTTIAVVPIGYGDGFLRSLSNRGSALVHGRRVPIVGRVSMDMITLDVTGIPGLPALYDEVVLIGSQEFTDPDGTTVSDSISVEEIARVTGTVSYEIPCYLTPRIPRVYTEDGVVIASTTMQHGFKIGR